ncbi:MAG: 50S ribosomal protein L11 methyltransferase, partial [Chloroflexi bacterium]|nr:50S ribosomal protein L11 methyltransferase [Chloroflexota bacterium]
MEFLEVSLTVSGELAEAAADVLTRFAPNGVATEATTFREFDDVETTGAIVSSGLAVSPDPVIVRAYLPDDDRLEDKRTRLSEALWHLRQLAAHSGLSIPEPEFRAVAQADWAEQWKEHFLPIRIGRRLIVVPTWLSPELAPDDVPLRLDPGMAFGTGTHPTTQLCLAAIESYLRPGDSVLDLGAGSGILAIAAAKLETFHGTSPPGRILALDIDDDAVRVARENIAANGVAASVQARL